MCGFAGYIDTRTARADYDWQACIRRMTNALVHRGPDSSGIWFDLAPGIALGHRRLSILDLSENGRQPMWSPSGRYVIVFNGEIYNFKTLRSDLAQRGYAFKGNSDTEVMLASIEAFGVEQSLHKFNGMFAFALWDTHARTLYLARDRLGEKPLYYGWCSGVFLFGSELKALAQHPAWSGDIDPEAVASYLRFNYVPGPRSIYRRIAKLPPGSFLSIPCGKSVVDSVPYWNLGDLILASRRAPWTGSEEEAVEALECHLKDAVRERMISDVPLGAFLSGGVDSSTVVAMMQAVSASQINTYSIGFEAADYNEAPAARLVSEHLGSRHTELCVTADAAMAVIPELVHIFDEPLADASQIPTLIVSRLARRHVTVALTGDGGDEVFGGYTRHIWGPRIWRRLAGVPFVLRRGVASGLRAVSEDRWDRTFERLNPLIPRGHRQIRPGQKLHKLAGALCAATPADVYTRLVTQWHGKHQEIAEALVEDCWRQWQTNGLQEVCDIEELMMFLDFMLYLPDDILVKADRASMAAGLEARMPFLDPSVISFAWSLPSELKSGASGGKHILRRLLHRHLPRGIVDRPKQGFGVPIGQWLRGPLRDWAEDLLDPVRMHGAGLLDVEAVQKSWTAHLSGKRNCENELWAVLMLQAWIENQQPPYIGRAQ